MGKPARRERKGFFSFLERFFRNRKRDSSSGEVEEVETPESFERELEKAKVKFRNFHLTGTMTVGSEIKRKNYSLKKTGPTIYRLEGENFQIVLVTGNSILEKEGMRTGVLKITEAELNRALQSEHKDLESFLKLWKPEFTNFFSKTSHLPPSLDWKRILKWEIFWKQQLLLRLRPDTVALLLVGLDQDFCSFILNTATRKQKKIYHDELFYLNRGKNSRDWNPYTKNKNLLEPDLAMQEFLQAIYHLEKKQEQNL